MDKQELISCFSEIGKTINQLCHGNAEDVLQHKFDKIKHTANIKNSWFIEEDFNYAVKGIAKQLNVDNLEPLFKKLHNHTIHKPKKVAVILSDYKPAYGFNEMLLVLVSGNSFVGKQMADDNEILEFVGGIIKNNIPDFSDRIHFEPDRLKNYDAVLANDNKLKPQQFERYFGRHPHYFENQKTSVGVLTDNESPDVFEKFGMDIFTYFGRSKYNITHLFVPEKYDFTLFLEHIENYKWTTNHTRYANRYEYYKSVFLLNRIPHLDNGFLLVREHPDLLSPVGTLHFTRYKNKSDVHSLLKKHSEKIESIISIAGFEGVEIAPGKSTRKTILEDTSTPAKINFLNSLQHVE